MKRINTLEYKGFKTEFYVTPKMEEFLEKKGMDLVESKSGEENEDVKIVRLLMNDPQEWYEFDLFESIGGEDTDKKNYKAVYYGAVEKWVDEEPEGFEEDFEYNEDRLVEEKISTVFPEEGKPFGVKCRVLETEE